MHERFSRGCVSPLGTGLLAQYGAALRPTIGRIEWAGTEAATLWNGYIGGAVRAGHDAALRVLKSL